MRHSLPTQILVPCWKHDAQSRICNGDYAIVIFTVRVITIIRSYPSQMPSKYKSINVILIHLRIDKNVINNIN